MVVRRSLLLGQLGNPEVEHLYVSVRSQHDVLRFDVAVHDTGIMRGSQRRSYLHGNFQCPMRTHSPGHEGGAKSDAFDELRRNELHLSLRADLINSQNVWMIERRGSSRLVLEPAQLCLVCR